MLTIRKIALTVLINLHLFYSVTIELIYSRTLFPIVRFKCITKNTRIWKEIIECGSVSQYYISPGCKYTKYMHCIHFLLRSIFPASFIIYLKSFNNYFKFKIWNSEQLRKIWNSEQLRKIWNSEQLWKIWNSEQLRKIWNSEQLRKIWNSEQLRKIWNSEQLWKIWNSEQLRKIWNSEQLRKSK